MGPRRRLLLALLILLSLSVRAQDAAEVDSDRDGLSDQLEQALITQFAPHFQVGQHDCAGLPALFQPGVLQPVATAKDGTVYGQAFPVRVAGVKDPVVELHFFDLWDRDCGAHGHPLDAEHVAVLLRGSSADLSTAKWKAVYWYAAAHENTVCDVSHLARASALKAEESGAEVWISPGKHAAYLAKALCNHGCGADACEAMRPMTISRIVNLGEPERPMSGSDFVASRAWALEEKMSQTDFPPEPIARLEALPEGDIAWFRAGRHPAQGVIAVSYTTGEAIAGSEHNTDAALALASDETGNALEKSYRKTHHALGVAGRSVGRALGSSLPKHRDEASPE